MQNDSNALCDIKMDMQSCENAASSMTIPTQPNASYGYNFFLDKSKKYNIEHCSGDTIPDDMYKRCYNFS